MVNLQSVLPCVFCRDSLTGFLASMRDVKRSALDGELDVWMYDLHNLVNDKLNVQQYVKMGVPTELQDGLLASCRVPLEIIRKRAVVAENRLFSILDVETVLCIIALNCSEVVNDEGEVVSSRKCSAFSSFLVLFTKLLQKTGMSQNHLDGRLAAVAERVASCDTPDDVLRLLIGVTSPHADFAQSKRRFNTARAKACSPATKLCR